MAITFETKWPAALSNAAWQKHKNFLDKAKAKTKTGLGQELVKAEAAWKLVQFKRLDAKQIPLPRPVDVDKAKENAADHLSTVGAAASKAALAAAAKAAATKDNKALSNSARKAAAAIEKGLLGQARLIRGIKLDDFDTAKSDLIQMTNQINLSTLKKGLVTAKSFVEAITTTPDRATFNGGVQNASRPLLVALGNIGAINGKQDPRPLGKDLEAWADGKDLLPSFEKKEDEEKAVLQALKKYKTAIKAIRSWAA